MKTIDTLYSILNYHNINFTHIHQNVPVETEFRYTDEHHYILTVTALRTSSYRGKQNLSIVFELYNEETTDLASIRIDGSYDPADDYGTWDAPLETK